MRKSVLFLMKTVLVLSMLVASNLKNATLTLISKSNLSSTRILPSPNLIFRIKYVDRISKNYYILLQMFVFYDVQVD